MKITITWTDDTTHSVSGESDYVDGNEIEFVKLARSALYAMEAAHLVDGLIPDPDGEEWHYESECRTGETFYHPQFIPGGCDDSTWACDRCGMMIDSWEELDFSQWEYCPGCAGRIDYDKTRPDKTTPLVDKCDKQTEYCEWVEYDGVWQAGCKPSPLKLARPEKCQDCGKPTKDVTKPTQPEPSTEDTFVDKPDQPPVDDDGTMPERVWIEQRDDVKRGEGCWWDYEREDAELTEYRKVRKVRGKASLNGSALCSGCHRRFSAWEAYDYCPGCGGEIVREASDE